MKQYLQQANNGDGFVLKKFYDIKPALDVYSSGYKSFITIYSKFSIY